MSDLKDSVFSFEAPTNAPVMAGPSTGASVGGPTSTAAAATATTANAVSEEQFALMRVQMQVLQSRLKDACKSIDGLRRDKEERNGRLTKVEFDLAKVKNERDVYKDTVESAEKAIGEVQERLLIKDADIRILHRKAEEKDQQAKNLRELNKKLVESVAALRAECANLRAESLQHEAKAALELQLSVLTSDNTRLADELQTAQQALETMREEQEALSRDLHEETVEPVNEERDLGEKLGDESLDSLDMEILQAAGDGQGEAFYESDSNEEEEEAEAEAEVEDDDADAKEEEEDDDDEKSEGNEVIAEDKEIGEAQEDDDDYEEEENSAGSEDVEEDKEIGEAADDDDDDEEKAKEAEEQGDKNDDVAEAENIEEAHEDEDEDIDIDIELEDVPDATEGLRLGYTGPVLFTDITPSAPVVSPLPIVQPVSKPNVDPAVFNFLLFAFLAAMMLVAPMSFWAERAKWVSANEQARMAVVSMKEYWGWTLMAKMMFTSENFLAVDRALLG